MTGKEYPRMVDGRFAMQDAPTLESTTTELVGMVLDLVDCDHGGYAEIDLHFDGTHLFSRSPDVSTWAMQKAEPWRLHMPMHPVLRFRQAHTKVPVIRLSDTTGLTGFYGSGLCRDPNDRPGSITSAASTKCACWTLRTFRPTCSAALWALA
jgi:hypothetical protein